MNFRVMYIGGFQLAQMVKSKTNRTSWCLATICNATIFLFGDHKIYDASSSSFCSLAPMILLVL